MLLLYQRAMRELGAPATSFRSPPWALSKVYYKAKYLYSGLWTFALSALCSLLLTRYKLLLSSISLESLIALYWILCPLFVTHAGIRLQLQQQLRSIGIVTEINEEVGVLPLFVLALISFTALCLLLCAPMVFSLSAVGFFGFCLFVCLVFFSSFLLYFLLFGCYCLLLLLLLLSCSSSLLPHKLIFSVCNTISKQMVNRHSRSWAVVRAVLCGGLYPNIARSDVKSW